MWNTYNKIGMISLLFLVGCDSIEHVNEPQIETRTMIIGGVPVHDRDYQIADRQVPVNEVGFNSITKQD